MTEVFDTALPLALGCEIRDSVTGVRGTAMYVLERLSGSRQWAIQSLGDSKTIPDAPAIDEQTLVRIGDGFMHLAAPASEVSIELGEEVIDIVTNFKGIAASRATYVNGCVHFGVLPKTTKAWKFPVEIYIDHKRLKVIGKGVSSKAVESIKKAKTGGPMTPRSSMRIG